MFLGINAFAHDASAALVDSEGRVVAAIEEERFTRRKREEGFPTQSIKACLEIAGATVSDVSAVAFPWHPVALLLGRTVASDMLRYPVRPTVWWENVKRISDALSIAKSLRREVGMRAPRVQYLRHHFAHAASAFYPSPFDEAAYLTIDGRGEAECVTWGIGRGARVSQLGHILFPHSIGKLYSAVCRFLGFDRAEKDGTVMALAGCGEPLFMNEFRQMLRLEPSQGFRGLRLSTCYFDLQDVALPSRKMEELLGVKVRQPGEAVTQIHKDIAASLQLVTQDAIMQLLIELQRQTGLQDVVLAGGVALNSVANGMILERTPFRRVFIQPAAHDGGLALGGALLLAHHGRKTRRVCSPQTAAFGPEYSEEQIRSELDTTSGNGLSVQQPPDLANQLAKGLANGQIVALFRGRMEFGPRALGNRSILADPRHPEIQQRLNSIKRREPFRPFAAAILHEDAGAWLCRATESPFMLLVDHFQPHVQSLVPGVQHADKSVRVQTVRKDVDLFFHSLIASFRDLTGVPMVLNTSLNVMGEPLACTPADALRVLQAGGIDALAIGNFLVTRVEAS